jgi:hypothetical protein
MIKRLDSLHDWRSEDLARGEEPDEDRLRQIEELAPGDMLQLSRNNESFWVTVISVAGERVEGKVENCMIMPDNFEIEFGDIVEFEKRHIGVIDPRGEWNTKSSQRCKIGDALRELAVENLRLICVGDPAARQMTPAAYRERFERYANEWLTHVGLGSDGCGFAIDPEDLLPEKSRCHRHWPGAQAQSRWEVDHMAAWCEIQRAKGRPNSNLTWANCLRETGVLTDDGSIDPKRGNLVRSQHHAH